LQPVPTQIGGVREWMDVRDLADRHGLEFSSGGYSLYSSFLIASASENSRVEYLYSIMHGLEKYFSTRPIWKNGSFIQPEISGLPVRINWDYCSDKIISEKTWHKRDIRQYNPIISM
jgi:L-alanine-DL-glutamate epimerase-like enolase superfamily enzyme